MSPADRKKNERVGQGEEAFACCFCARLCAAPSRGSWAAGQVQCRPQVPGRQGGGLTHFVAVPVHLGAAEGAGGGGRQVHGLSELTQSG